DCHGSSHTTDDDVHKVEVVTPETCAESSCHEKQVRQYRRGKHALAWTVTKEVPTFHWQPMSALNRKRGCIGCHKIGEKSKEEIERLKREESGYGYAACDSCHTRHTFSVQEAKQPQACQTCHMGFDHPQWEMYSGSKHGVRALLKQSGSLPETYSAPTCQDCHMKKGNHEVRTPWGFLAIRLPLPEDPEWRADQLTIMQAMGILDADGKPTKRMEIFKNGDMLRVTQADFDRERNKLLVVCDKCHSENFAKDQLAKGDLMIKEVDHLLAEAIRTISALYRDGLLEKPGKRSFPYFDLLTFYGVRTPIEQKLFEMHLERRMRAFQGAFHSNPVYSLWFGWNEMQRGLIEIRALSDELRDKAKSEK
ncbi:MAG: cytochrome C, partial [Gammaproteobacteria bacterium]|nr:cytochrome C [Gammaproteobacteria bacterium]